MHSRRGIAVIAAVLLVLPVQLLLHRSAGSEPYPALFMPAFGGVPVERGQVVVTRLTLVATSGTRSVQVDPVELMPNKTMLAESIARFFFEDEGAVREVAANGWLLRRLADVDVEADTMEVVKERLFLDPDSHEVDRVTTLSRWSVPVERGAA